MRITGMAMVLLLGVVLASGCTSSEVNGIYDNSCDLVFPDQYLELKSDGTFCNYLTVEEPQLGYNGTWRVEGDNLILDAVLMEDLPIDISIKETWTMEGDSLIDERGCAWIKR